MIYIDSPTTILVDHYELDRSITGLYSTNELYESKNRNKELLFTPEADMVYINPELSEVYGVKIGDILNIQIAGVIQSFIVKDIAVNATSKNIYMNEPQLAKILGAAPGSYNGDFGRHPFHFSCLVYQFQRQYS